MGKRRLSDSAIIVASGIGLEACWIALSLLQFAPALRAYETIPPPPGPLAAAVVAILAASGICFAVAARAAVRGFGEKRLRRVTIGFAALFTATLFCSGLPVASRDVFLYASAARMSIVHDENPYVTPHDAEPDDPLYPYMRRSWADWPTVYGPIWTALSYAPAAAGGGEPHATVTAFRATAAVFIALTAVAVAAIARRIAPGREGAALLIFLWNPLLLFESIQNAHNDIAMVFGMTAAAALLLGNRFAWSAVALTAAGLVKYFALALAPLLALAWWYRTAAAATRIRSGLVIVAASAALTVAAWYPFWEGARTFTAAQNHMALFYPVGAGIIYTVISFAIAALDAATGGAAAWIGSLSDDHTLYRGLALALLAGAMAYALRRYASGARAAADTVEAILLILMAVLAATHWFVPWYLLWLLPWFAAMNRWKAAVALAALDAVDLIGAGAFAVVMAAAWYVASRAAAGATERLLAARTEARHGS